MDQNSRQTHKAQCGEHNVRTEHRRSTAVVTWISYSPLDPRFPGSNPAGVDGFSERKNAESDFLRKGSKAVGPVS